MPKPTPYGATLNGAHRAQGVACRAYIQSQKHEGWVLVEKTYSDGGISGGTLNRPALQELLQDIKNGLVDIIGVYKIDRLTRSPKVQPSTVRTVHKGLPPRLFAKLVEVFDKHSTSFLKARMPRRRAYREVRERRSITQQFNTSTSMGRLTLNMLLSFAQFEREVTGERIRDKKKAMAIKGMWGSGVTPFGYDKIDKKLFPNKDHAERVRKIFDLYIELRSVNAVKQRLQELNIQTQNGRDWSDGNLYNILQRKLYLGKIEHHGETYDGQHEAIVDKEVFRKVQQIVSENRRRSASKISHAPRHPWQAWHTQHPVAKGKHNSLLAGKIFDSEGWAMSPSHSAKRPPGRGECRVGTDAQERRGRRYRYYISQAYLRKEKDKAGNLPQIPAPNTEELVSNELRNLLKLQLVNMEGGLEQQQAYEENWHKFVKDWSLLEPKIFILIRQILQKIVVSNKGLEFRIDQDNLKMIAEIIFRGYKLPEELGKSDNTLSYTKLCKIEQVRHGKSFVIEEKNYLNNSLVNALKQAWEWNDWIAEGKYKSARDIAKALDYNTPRRVENVMRLRYLSPRIQLMILKGTQPKGWTTRHLFSYKQMDWAEQEKELGL